MQCSICGNDMPACEEFAYGERCEDCYVAHLPTSDKPKGYNGRHSAVRLCRSDEPTLYTRLLERRKTAPQCKLPLPSTFKPKMST